MIWIIISAVGGMLLGVLMMFLLTVRPRKHKKVPSLTKYVAFSIGLLVGYSITELVLVTLKGLSHDTLTTCLFATFGGEILSCALIKIFKLKEEKKNEPDNF